MEKGNYINSINLNIDTDFPYLVLDVEGDKACPRNPGFQVMHWHEDLQFIYVLDGIIEVRTLDDALQIQA
ncbi:MAG TPA: cupin domain-containing protein, partial [Candidatus Mediterraneibacter merdavium]|nr:cupin domain-containing protein [Candidatus Mediterraneibacter merdavium]